MKRYTDWFWENHLRAHFEFEEMNIFPILGHKNPLIKRALMEHQRLKKLISESGVSGANLSLIERELVLHIRFEERVLFQEVEVIATQEQMDQIVHEHSTPIVEDWNDEFWVAPK